MQITIFDGPEVSPQLVYEVAQYLHPGDDTLFLRGRPEHDLTYLAAVRLAAEKPVYLSHSWLRQFGPQPMATHRYRVLERLSLGRQVVRVIVLPRGQPFDSLEAARTHAAYEVAAAFPTRLPTVLVDGSEPTIAVAGIVESMRLPANPGPGVGAWRPGASIVLVGERPNLQRGQSYLGPFCPWTHGGCSAWLSKQLETAGIPERDLYWINAYDVYRQPTDAGFLEDLQPRAIVTLGATASDWLVGEGCPAWVYQRHHQVAHPNYWKRFQHTQPYPLLDVLRRLSQPAEAAA